MVQLRSPHLIDHAKWVEWMNDKEINRFLESRFTLYTLEDCRKWEVSWDQSKTHSIWDGKIFVGMASVYDVAPFHDVGGLSILPLNKALWGRGIATEVSMILMNRWPYRLWQRSTYGANIRMQRVFVKCGFTCAAEIMDFYSFEGGYTSKQIWTCPGVIINGMS